MASIQFTDADRDERGFVTVPAPTNPEPRSLADLLPPIGTPAQATKKKAASKVEQITMFMVAIVSIAALVYVGGSGGDVAPPIPARAPAAAQSSGDASTTPSPLPAAAPAVTGRLLIAFASPNGEPLGAIESTRPITPTAHYGDDWIQADVQGSGLVWLRAADSPDLAIVGPDLAPRAAPQAPAAAPVAPRAAEPPPPTPEPQPPCQTSGVPGKTVEVCGWGDLAAEAQAKWIETYGGNIGVVDHPTPQIRSTP